MVQTVSVLMIFTFLSREFHPHRRHFAYFHSVGMELVSINPALTLHLLIFKPQYFSPSKTFRGNLFGFPYLKFIWNLLYIPNRFKIGDSLLSSMARAKSVIPQVFPTGCNLTVFIVICACIIFLRFNLLEYYI